LIGLILKLTKSIVKFANLKFYITDVYFVT